MSYRNLLEQWLSSFLPLIIVGSTFVIFAADETIGEDIPLDIYLCIDLSKSLTNERKFKQLARALIAIREQILEGDNDISIFLFATEPKHVDRVNIGKSLDFIPELPKKLKGRDTLYLNLNDFSLGDGTINLEKETRFDLLFDLLSEENLLTFSVHFLDSC